MFLGGWQHYSLRVCRDGQVMAESEHYSASFTDTSVETWDQGGGNMVGLDLSSFT